MEIFGCGSPDELAQARLALLIERFSELSDDREPHPGLFSSLTFEVRFGIPGSGNV